VERRIDHDNRTRRTAPMSEAVLGRCVRGPTRPSHAVRISLPLLVSRRRYSRPAWTISSSRWPASRSLAGTRRTGGSGPPAPWGGACGCGGRRSGWSIAAGIRIVQGAKERGGNLCPPSPPINVRMIIIRINDDKSLAQFTYSRHAAKASHRRAATRRYPWNP